MSGGIRLQQPFVISVQPALMQSISVHSGASPSSSFELSMRPGIGAGRRSHSAMHTLKSLIASRQRMSTLSEEDVEAIDELSYMAVVRQRLATIASTHNVSIVHACETGSRAWRSLGSLSKRPALNPSRSPLQVHFVYASRNASSERFASLQLNKEDQLAGISYTTSPSISLVGYDLDQALSMAADMQPTLIEMLYSPIVYESHDDYHFAERVRAVVERFPSQLSTLLHHFNQKVMRVYFDELLSPAASSQTVSLDDYVEAIRYSAMFDWVLNHPLTKRNATNAAQTSNKIVELDLDTLVASMHMDVDVYTSVLQVLAKWRASKVCGEGRVARSKCIDDWIYVRIKAHNYVLFRLKGALRSQPLYRDQLNKVLLRSLAIRDLDRNGDDEMKF